MFTGIVEELGEVLAVEPLPDACRLTVRGPLVTSDAGHGDSIAVNGVCLTVVSNEGGAFTADVMAETLERSSLGALEAGSPVNLERAVRVSDRLGGHVVQGQRRRDQADLEPGVGDPVNLEVDVMAKYVEKLLLAGVRPVTANEEKP